MQEERKELLLRATAAATENTEARKMGNLFIRRPDPVADASQFCFFVLFVCDGPEADHFTSHCAIMEEKKCSLIDSRRPFPSASTGSLAGLKAKSRIFIFLM